MPRPRLRTIATIAGVLVALVVWAAVGERIAARDGIYHRVDIAGADVSGKSTDDALAELVTLASTLELEPWSVHQGDTLLTLDPTAVEYRVDTVATIDDARARGRSRNPIEQVWGTVLRMVRPDEVPLVATWDDERLEEILDFWSATFADGLTNGGLAFEGATVIEIEPRDGVGLLRDEARQSIEAGFASAARDDIALEVGDTSPAVDAEEVARAAGEARAILAEPVVVTFEGTEVAIAPENLGPTMNARARGSRLILGIDTEALRTVIAPTVEPFEVPPVDATFAVDGATVSVVPSVTGRVLDLDSVVEKILDGEHRIAGQLVDREPERNTAWAEALNITDLVSTYTTNYPAGQPRVRNIQRAAEIVDGTIVEPGETFSLNETIGPRTPEAGFVEAPAFSEQDGFFETYGGGVSQFSTTVLNATFFGGYEIVEFTPHSIYISRYPMGREATLDYPGIDNKFRNDTESGVLVKASAGASSVTVTYYGNTGGRTVDSEGPNVIEEIPIAEKVVETDWLPVGERRPIAGEGGFPGIVVENFRILHYPGQPDVRQRFTWTYDMRPRQVLVGTGPAPELPPEEPLPPEPPAEPPLPPPPTPPTPAQLAWDRWPPAQVPGWFGSRTQRAVRLRP